MLDHRNLKTDLLALGLLAAGLFLGTSLLSYSPADPPSQLVFPERTHTGNLCGRSGSMVSTLLFEGLGIGAYYLLMSVAILDAVLLARRQISMPLVRLIGWLVSLAGLCTLAAMAVPRLSPGPVIGSGGYLGAAGRALLERNFAAAGAYIIVVSLILGGLMLSTDYVVLKILAWTLGVPAKSLGRGAVRVGRAYADKMGRRRSDLDPPADDDDRPQQTARPVRITSRSQQSAPQEPAKAADKAGARQPGPPEGLDPAAAKEPGSEPRIRKPAKAGREDLLGSIEPDTGAGLTDYELPAADLLLGTEPARFEEHEKEVRRKARILERTFANFGFNVQVVEIQTGPVIAQYEVELEAGLRLSRIAGLADDLAIALRVPSVRIVAPIPGKNTVGVEVPNNERQIVRLREVMEEASNKAQAMRIPIFLGKDVAGSPLVVDLSTLPHLLIAGRTGTGKSVALNSIIVSILMTRRPDEVRMLLIDPKMVELSPYKSIPHLMHPVVTDMRKAEAILGWAVEKMEERYQLLARAGVRHISVYNQLGEEELMDRIRPADEQERRDVPTHLPYIVMVADEMADLMMTSAKEVETHIIRLAQKSRAVGIHLVLATQKPTVDVITGLIKSNLPARICFQVASRTDSRVVLDEMGAERLLGNGDLLFLWPGTSTILRGQGTYVSDDEINRVIQSVATAEPQYIKELVQLKASESEPEGRPVSNRDDLYDQAVELVVREGRGSCSLLQRAMGIGYGRAARLIDFMAEDGIVGAYNGSQAREVLLGLEQWEARRGRTLPRIPALATPPPPDRPGNKILLSPGPARRDRPPLREPLDPMESDEDDPPFDEAPEDDGEEDPEDEADDEGDEVDEEDPEHDSDEEDRRSVEPEDDADDEPEGEDEGEDQPDRRKRPWKAESA